LIAVNCKIWTPKMGESIMIPYDYNKMNILLFQHRMYDLEMGHYKVLESEDFCQDLLAYLQRLFDLGKRDVVAKVLKKIGLCVAGDHNNNLRTRALRIVTDFTDELSGHKDREIFQLVAQIVSRWLEAERQSHPDHKKLFGQIRTIVQKMFSLQLWGQAAPVVAVSKRISTGELHTERTVTEEVSKLHKSIAEKQSIDAMISCFQQTRKPALTGVAGLLVALTPHSSEAMIHSLFKSGKRSCRLALLGMISKENEGVLPILIEKLKDRQPWYVLRNSMILLGCLKDPDLYHFARPFLSHPDERVQRESVLAVAALGGPNVAERLVASFPRVYDRVKLQVIKELLPYNSGAIHSLFLSCLEQRHNFSPEIREELIDVICSSNKLIIDSKTAGLLNSIVEERESGSTSHMQAAEFARNMMREL